MIVQMTQGDMMKMMKIWNNLWMRIWKKMKKIDFVVDDDTIEYENNYKPKKDKISYGYR